MRLTTRDSAVVAALVLALVVLGGALAVPASLPREAVAEPTPPPTLPPPVTYREGVVGTADSITPLTARTRAERTLVGLVFSGLVRTGPEQALQPDLAASWSASDDGTTWTFTIRDDARWQDGVPVTSADVVYTVDALKDPDASGAVSSSWAGVTAEAVDERTVRFTLATPVGGFLAAASQPLLPAHLLADVPFAELGTSDFARRPIGTGPFALTERDATHAVLVPASSVQAPVESPAGPSVSPDSLATPVPRPTAEQPVPFVERIELRFYPDDAAAADALLAGDVDAVAGVGPDTGSTLGAAAGIERIRYPTTTLSTVVLNLRPSHRELRDPRVRRALLAALDRDALVRDVLGEDALRADALVPPSSWAYDATAAAPVAFDLDAAVTTLRDAGWVKLQGTWAPKGAKKAYELELASVPADANPRLAAEAAFVRDSWTRLGFKVHLVERSGADLTPNLRSGAFTAAVLDIRLGVEPDLYGLLASSQVRGGGSNLSGFQDPSLDTLLVAARAPGTDAARKAAWTALLAGIAARQPMLPLAWDEESVFARGLEGVTPTLISDTGDRYWDVLAWRLAADR